jgi:hypothetical protein
VLSSCPMQKKALSIPDSVIRCIHVDDSSVNASKTCKDSLNTEKLTHSFMNNNVTQQVTLQS